MITTNDEALYKKLLKLRTHGITRESGLFTNALDLVYGSESDNTAYPGWYMEMQELGFNYRLTDFQAALGLSQLNRADQGLARRIEIAQKYSSVFEKERAIISHSGLVNGHAYHLYVICVEKRAELYSYLRSKQIFCQVHYIPVHLHPYYQSFGWKQGDFPNAENYYRNCLSLPMFPTLTDEEQEFVIKEIKSFLNQA